jgi:hypothetical protein
MILRMTQAQTFSRRPIVPEDLPRQPPGRAFARAAFATARAAFDGRNPTEVAEMTWPTDRQALVTTKAATAPASTGTSSWAGALSPTSTIDWIASLAPQSAAARLIDAGMKVSLEGQTAVLIPHRSSNLPNLDATWVAELSTVPVRSLTLATTQVGPTKKLASSVVLTREMATAADGEAVFSKLLAEDLIASFDATVFGSLAATSARPAGLVNGVTAISAASGGSETALRSDVANLAAVVSATGSNNIAFVCSPLTATKLAIYPTVVGPSVQVWPSIGVADGVLICLAVDAFVSAFAPIPRIRISQDAVLVMDDTAPAALGTAGSPNVVGAPGRSLYQSDSIAVRAILDVAYAMRAANAVSWISTGLSW